MIGAFLLCTLLLVWGCEGHKVGEICPNQLSSAITALIANCSICQRAYWGIRVDEITSDGRTTLFSMNDEKYFTPASNNKLLTTSVAFLELGPDFSVTTPVYLSSNGDLCLVGKGDPSIAYDSLLGLAEMLNLIGVTSVHNVYVDNSYYTGTSVPGNWEWGDITEAWGAQPSPLISEENVISFKLHPTAIGELISANFTFESDAAVLQLAISAHTSSPDEPSSLSFDIEPVDSTTFYITGTMAMGSDTVTVELATLDPARRFALLWADALVSNNIAITGTVGVSPCSTYATESAGWKKVAIATSPSLLDMMNYTLQFSDNLYAETFLRHLGKTMNSSEPADTDVLGIEKVQSVLTKVIGLSKDSFSQDDGSGLSRHNLVTPAALVDIIFYMHSAANGSTYLSFFPTAGESGTLVDRFVNTTAQGILHAKTGTLGGVNALSGFVDHGDSAHPVLVFSVIANDSAESSVPPIDEIGVLLASVVNC